MSIIPFMFNNPYRRNSFYIDDILGHSIRNARDNHDSLQKKKPKKKKARTTFTSRQISELEKKFQVKKYLTSPERMEMAILLDVTETQVKIW